MKPKTYHDGGRDEYRALLRHLNGLKNWCVYVEDIIAWIKARKDHERKRNGEP